MAARRRQRLRRLAVPVLIVVLAIVALIVYRNQPPPSPWGSTMQLATPHGTGGVAWSPDGAQVATGGTATDSVVRIWNAGSGALIHTIAEPSNSRTRAVAWSPSGAYLAIAQQPAASKGSTPTGPLLQLWQTGTWTAQSGSPAHVAAAVALSFSPDGKAIAAQNTSATQILAVPNLATRKALIKNPLQALSFATVLAWAPRGGLIAISDGNAEIVLLHVQSLQVKHILQLSGTYPTNLIGGAAWSPSGAQIAIANIGGNVSVFDVATGHVVRTISAAQHGASTMAWAPDGRRLAVGGNNSLAIYDTRSGTVLRRQAAPGDAQGAVATGNQVVGLAWSPDGRRLAVSGSAAYTRIWQPAATGGS
ncbi:MAG TPA: WD40 repeat domain-containing protein [Chloroflexota bacterium]|nr:WD40 repeat domain-containing protein [Chloroflexota bacterium]